MEETLAGMNDWKKGEKDEVSDKQTKEIEDLDGALDLLNMTKKAKKDLDDAGGDTGKLQTLYQDFKGVMPGFTKDAKFGAVQQLSGTALVDMIKAKSGTAYSVQELASMKLNTPTSDDKPQEFNRKLLALEGIIKSARKRKLDLYQKQGKDSSNFKTKESKPKTINQNGHTYTLNEQTGEYE